MKQKEKKRKERTRNYEKCGQINGPNDWSDVCVSPENVENNTKMVDGVRRGVIYLCVRSDTMPSFCASIRLGKVYDDLQR